MNADPATILLIEDDPEQLRALAAQLSGAGHDCVAVSSGEHALEAWCARSFDLVVTDLRLPGLDGCDLIEHFSEAELVPVIVVTGFCADFSRWLCGAPGIVVLEKPVPPARFLAEVAAVIARARAANHNAHHGSTRPPAECTRPS